MATIHFPDLVTGSTSEEILSITVSPSSKPSGLRKKLREINFPVRYWAALNQQKTTSSKKELRSEVKLRNACSHLYQQLEKMERGISKTEPVQGMMMKQKTGLLQASFPKEFVAR